MGWVEGKLTHAHAVHARSIRCIISRKLPTHRHGPRATPGYLSPVAPPLLLHAWSVTDLLEVLLVGALLLVLVRSSKPLGGCKATVLLLRLWRCKAAGWLLGRRAGGRARARHAGSAHPLLQLQLPPTDRPRRRPAPAAAAAAAVVIEGAAHDRDARGAQLVPRRGGLGAARVRQLLLLMVSVVGDVPASAAAALLRVAGGGCAAPTVPARVLLLPLLLVVGVGEALAPASVLLLLLLRVVVGGLRKPPAWLPSCRLLLVRPGSKPAARVRQLLQELLLQLLLQLLRLLLLLQLQLLRLLLRRLLHRVPLKVLPLACAASVLLAALRVPAPLALIRWRPTHLRRGGRMLSRRKDGGPGRRLPLPLLLLIRTSSHR